MKTSDFHYDLPQELIAQAPLPQRSASRLLHVPAAPAPFQDRHICDLPGLLRAGDLLVFNDTKVIPARLFGAKRSGGRVEVLIERLLGPSEALAQIRASKAPKPGGLIDIDSMQGDSMLGDRRQGEGMQVEVTAREGDFHRLRFATDDLAG
ncbi:MAG TPA: S-adenosylmethionine:tRNA ribosyltransferase-isomerase, partial [Xanthomonadaceae bacterium]|nr:S-adenosylmethionine:tRNA ribosyltransferase-isomerase [Xanthomonadaceae bacterium]